MKAYSIIALILLVSLIEGQVWDTPIALVTSDVPITYQKHFIDESDMSKHFIYAVQEARKLDILYYRKVFRNGTITSPMVILKNQAHDFSDITGANDGQRIFIVLSAKRNSTSEYFDNFFLESKNGGINWTTPSVLPRINTSDVLNRYYPNIQFSEEMQRLWVYYFKSESKTEKGIISYATRPKGSIIFNTEMDMFKDVEVDGKLVFKLTEGKHRLLHLAYHKQNKEIDYWYSPNGIKWEYISCSESRHTPSYIDVAVHDAIPKHVYILTGYDEGEDDRGLYPYVLMHPSEECTDFQKYWKASLTPDMVSNDFCETDTGMVFLAYATKAKGDVGTTIGTIFAKNLTAMETGAIGVNPLASMKPTNVDYPDLKCWYDPTTKGHVSVSGIAFHQDSGKYKLYITEAKLTSQWT